MCYHYAQGERVTCSIVLLFNVILERVLRGLHIELREVARPPHTLIYIEPCNHVIYVISQARLITVKLGIDVQLMLQDTYHVLVLLEQEPKVLVILTRLRHVRWRHRLLRHRLLLLVALGFIFVIPNINVFGLRPVLPDHDLVSAAEHGRKFLKCSRAHLCAR